MGLIFGVFEEFNFMGRKYFSGEMGKGRYLLKGDMLLF